MNTLNIGENIFRFRQEKKLTQENLADYLGVTKSAVSKWEKNQSTPDILLLPQLATFFAVSVDELLGYEAQLSKEQIRRYYEELEKAFTVEPLIKVREKMQHLGKKYYSCAPLLLQLSLLTVNHFMLYPQKVGEEMLQEALSWCQRILTMTADLSVKNEALTMEGMLYLQLGQGEKVIELFEETEELTSLTSNRGTFLIQAYEMTGKKEKAQEHLQVKYYLSLCDLLGNIILSLSIVPDLAYGKKTILRGEKIISVYNFVTLHPNLAGQFYFQSAVFFANHGLISEALNYLEKFQYAIDELLAHEVVLHGDSYFNQLDAWIEGLPLGNLAPRDKKFIKNNLTDALNYPGFSVLASEERFLKIKNHLLGGKNNA